MKSGPEKQLQLRLLAGLGRARIATLESCLEAVSQALRAAHLHGEWENPELSDLANAHWVTSKRVLLFALLQARLVSKSITSSRTLYWGAAIHSISVSCSLRTCSLTEYKFLADTSSSFVV